MSIHQNHSRAVDWNSLFFANREFESVTRQIVNRRLRPGQKIPATRLSLKFVRVTTAEPTGCGMGSRSVSLSKASSSGSIVDLMLLRFRSCFRQNKRAEE